MATATSSIQTPRAMPIRSRSCTPRPAPSRSPSRSRPSRPSNDALSHSSGGSSPAPNEIRWLESGNCRASGSAPSARKSTQRTRSRPPSRRPAGSSKCTAQPAGSATGRWATPPTAAVSRGRSRARPRKLSRSSSSVPSQRARSQLERASRADWRAMVARAVRHGDGRQLAVLRLELRDGLAVGRELQVQLGPPPGGLALEEVDPAARRLDQGRPCRPVQPHRDDPQPGRRLQGPVGEDDVLQDGASRDGCELPDLDAHARRGRRDRVGPRVGHAGEPHLPGPGRQQQAAALGDAAGRARPRAPPTPPRRRRRSRRGSTPPGSAGSACSPA